MLVQLLNMKRLEEEEESRLGKEKEEPNTATFLFYIALIEHMNCMQLNYLVCIHLPRVHYVALNPDV